MGSHWVSARLLEKSVHFGPVNRSAFGLFSRVGVKVLGELQGPRLHNEGILPGDF